MWPSPPISGGSYWLKHVFSGGQVRSCIENYSFSCPVFPWMIFWCVINSFVQAIKVPPRFWSKREEGEMLRQYKGESVSYLDQLRKLKSPTSGILDDPVIRSIILWVKIYAEVSFPQVSKASWDSTFTAINPKFFAGEFYFHILTLCCLRLLDIDHNL